MGIWWEYLDLNQGLRPYEDPALTTELYSHEKIKTPSFVSSGWAFVFCALFTFREALSIELEISEANNYVRGVYCRLR